MNPISQHSIRVNDLDITYLAAGLDNTGPLAVCLHGFPDSAHTWRHLLPRLADAGYRAVAPFLRGYAPTEVPSDGRFQTAASAMDALALGEALGGVKTWRPVIPQHVDIGKVVGRDDEVRKWVLKKEHVPTALNLCQV